MSWIKPITSRLSSYRHRALALLAAHLVGYLLLGSAIVLPGIPDDEWVALDQWVRTAVFALVRPGDTTPVTYIDIDNALYRDTWGMPTVTPRGELAKILAPLATSGASLLVVDIDIAWGDRNPALATFLRDYAGPAQLVFVRHIEDTDNGLEEIATPYDEVFAANSAWLQWAHAYFISDGDGALREWLPWLALCGADTTRVLPSVATIAAGTARPPSLASEECPAVVDLDAYPIIYTEEFGFASADSDDADIGFPSADSAARKVPARYLLDGTNIDFAALFKGRVAIVGGSHAAGQDLRLTPLGVLPGAVVQANTIMHARPQLASGDSPEFLQRIIVATLFLILCLVSFPIAALIVVLIAAISAGAFSHYAIFMQLQLAALLFIQFRVLAWLCEPFWKDFREFGWRILLPDYLRNETEAQRE